MMRHFAIRAVISISIVGCSADALATPVYLKPESRFPSGHYTRQMLENRTKKVQFQRWLRVETKDKAIGWLPEESAVTALQLATEATLNEPAPLRSEMLMDALDGEILPKGTRVFVLDTQASWVRARVIYGNGERRDTWIPTESLKPTLNTPILKAFIPKASPVFSLPGLTSKILFQAHTNSFTTVLKESVGWLEIQSAQGKGFIRRSDVLTASDLALVGARPASDLVPLRSAPLPYADVLRNLPSGSVLKIVQTQTLRWGHARVPEIGEMWWPIVDENDDEKDLIPREKISTPALFQRKIFDMASSPAIPQLKFASAEGVFRTIDGNEWTKLPTFQDKNYPIAIAGGGAVFVGPFVSDDHGETFQQWIRWDTLVATLKQVTKTSPSTLQLQEIHPEDPTGRRVVVKVGTGHGSFRIVTEDQGLSWHSL